MNEVRTEDALRIYRALRRIRRVEEVIADLYPSDKIKSPVHLSIGQEAVAVGVCDVLRQDDLTAMTYRGHATYLAKGGDLKAMMAELYGKVTGCARGKAGSMHLVDMEHNVLGASAVVATTIPMSAGVAHAIRQEGSGRVVCVFFGDGATEEGAFTETIHFAALRRLPLLFVLEDNGYAIHSPKSKRWPTGGIKERMETYGLICEAIESGDVFSIRRAADRLIAAIRRGEGPAFLACKTYRWREHVGPNEDRDAVYRHPGLMETWQTKDPVELVGASLDSVARDAIDEEIEAEIRAAVEFAEASPFPDESELYDHVYADGAL